MNALLKAWNRIREAKGQGMAEYGLILALVAVVAMVALTPLGTNIAAIFTNVSSVL